MVLAAGMVTLPERSEGAESDVCEVCEKGGNLAGLQVRVSNAARTEDMSCLSSCSVLLFMLCVTLLRMSVGDTLGFISSARTYVCQDQRALERIGSLFYIYNARFDERATRSSILSTARVLPSTQACNLSIERKSKSSLS